MKSYYMLDIGAYMCRLVVKVNDIEVFTINIDGQMSTEIPINIGILENGLQAIEVFGYPLQVTKGLDKNSYIRYKVIMYDVSNKKFKLMQVWENNYTSPPQKGIPLITHRSEFHAIVPYKLEAWQNGVYLKDVNFDIKQKLIVEYNKLVNYVNSANYDALITAYNRREKNNAISMYLDDMEATFRIEKIISDIKNGFKTMPVSQNSILELSAYGKLACLKRLDGYSALYLENQETNEEIILQIFFFLPEGKAEFEIM